MNESDKSQRPSSYKKDLIKVYWVSLNNPQKWVVGFIAAFLVIIVLYSCSDSSDNAPSESSKSTSYAANPQSSAKAASRFIAGKDYSYYNDDSCKPSDVSVCLDKEAFRTLCNSVKGVTKSLASSAGRLNSIFGDLIDNGDFDGWNVTYDSAYKKGEECRMSMTASGMINGSSRRVTVSGYVSTFIVNDKNEILAKYGFVF